MCGWWTGFSIQLKHCPRIWSWQRTILENVRELWSGSWGFTAKSCKYRSVDPAVTSSNGPIFTNNHSFKYDSVCVFKSSQWSIKQVHSGFAGLLNGRENSKEVALEREATTSREREGKEGQSLHLERRKWKQSLVAKSLSVLRTTWRFLPCNQPCHSS